MSFLCLLDVQFLLCNLVGVCFKVDLCCLIWLIYLGVGGGTLFYFCVYVGVCV